MLSCECQKIGSGTGALSIPDDHITGIRKICVHQPKTMQMRAPKKGADGHNRGAYQQERRPYEWLGIQMVATAVCSCTLGSALHARHMCICDPPTMDSTHDTHTWTGRLQYHPSNSYADAAGLHVLSGNHHNEMRIPKKTCFRLRLTTKPCELICLRSALVAERTLALLLSPGDRRYVARSNSLLDLHWPLVTRSIPSKARQEEQEGTDMNTDPASGGKHVQCL